MPVALRRTRPGLCGYRVDAYGAEFEFHTGQTGLALGLRAGVGLALAVAALELLAGVDGGQMSELLLARDLVGRALDDGGHCAALSVL